MSEQNVDRKPHPIKSDLDRVFWGSLDTAGALFRWILASLVTLNGGAIAIVLNWDRSADAAKVSESALLFFGGAVLAVVGAMLFAGAMVGMGFFLPTLDAGAEAEGDEGERPDPMRWVVRILLYGLVSCIASLGCFAAGGLLFASAVETSTVDKQKVSPPGTRVVAEGR